MRPASLQAATKSALAKHSPNQREPRQIGPSREGPFFWFMLALWFGAVTFRLY